MIFNPKPAPVDLTAPHVKNKDAVLAFIAAAPATQRAIAFSDVRAALALTAAQLPDGAIMQICLDAGIKCDA